MSWDSEPETLLPSALEDAEAHKRSAAAAFLVDRPGDTLKGGRYRPFRKPGQGQFSSVWLARDLDESRYVAIKTRLGWLVEEQLREASILRQLREQTLLSHPGRGTTSSSCWTTSSTAGPTVHHTRASSPVQ
jgi:hypothetical protein